MEREASRCALYVGFLGLALVGLFGTTLRTQEIRIRVLNGHNGRPVTNECVSVWVGPVRGPSLVIPTDQNGIAMLRITRDNNEAISRRRSPACNGMAAIDPVVAYADAIEITSDYYVPCQAHPPDSPALAFSVRKVLDSGDVTANACGKIEASPKPGELILFVRPMHWWEGIRQ